VKHNIKECRVKLRAIHKIAGQIKAGMTDDTIEKSLIIMLAEQIQQDTSLLEREEG